MKHNTKGKLENKSNFFLSPSVKKQKKTCNMQINGRLINQEKKKKTKQIGRKYPVRQSRD